MKMCFSIEMVQAVRAFMVPNFPMRISSSNTKERGHYRWQIQALTRTALSFSSPLWTARGLTTRMLSLEKCAFLEFIGSI